ncbi:MAG: hypothetical protein CSA95_02175 [Bacteroidetes bacterium]|nr:MAG: hypothetical protein CSA95_02175 [Bacteroidota bacterium]PIE88533.1 MAG: hypothetical protein CSA04_01435 [Bacteroidota bacterium]
MKNLKEALSGVLETINGAAKDVSSVEVTTLTGDVKKVFNGEKIDLKSTVESLKGDTQGEVRLLAHTHIDFDQDATQFFSDDIAEKDALLLELHQEMVDSAMASRSAFLDFVKEIFG